LSTSTLPTLHVPDEPTALADAWLAAIQEGSDLSVVLAAPDGLTVWLWSRWSALAAAGMTEAGFQQVVEDNRREFWLWLAGERTWIQVVSGLIGRVSRRIVQVGAPDA